MNGVFIPAFDGLCSIYAFLIVFLGIFHYSFWGFGGISGFLGVGYD